MDPSFLWLQAGAPGWASERQREADRFFLDRPELAGVRARVAECALLGRRSAPTTLGGRRFSLRQPHFSRPPVVVVRDAGGASERVIVDVAAWASPEAPWLDWWYPSPDGRRVAFGVSAHASEQSVLHVVDVDTGGLLPDRIPDTSFGVVAWLPDSSGFYYNRSLDSDLVNPQKRIFLHRLGQAPESVPEAAITRPDEEYVYPLLSDDGRWLAAMSGDVEPRPDSIRDLRSDAGWRTFLIDTPGTFVGCFEDDSYVCITTHGAPVAGVVRIPLPSGTATSTWKELVPEGPGVMRQVSVRGERLVVVDLVDTSARIRVFGVDGRQLDTVPLATPTSLLPSAVHGQAMMDPLVHQSEDRLTFVTSGFATPPTVAAYEFDSRQLRVSEPEPALPIALRAELVHTRGRDGTEVSYWLVQPRDATGPRPALMYGYGGWNLAFGLPGFLAELLPFVELGGAVVLPHLRGDGTYGESYWHEGRLAQKQRTFDDAALVAAHLVETGVAAPHAIALVGASNGGLLAAAAVTQNPQLFRAVVPLVPLTDMMNYTRDAYPAEFRTEYGDPSDAAMRAVLESYSPVHAVRPGVEYPSVLVVCGDHDIRCPAWHGQRFVAALREANTSDHPILLHIQPHSGHMIAQSVSAPEWLAFVVSELGMVRHESDGLEVRASGAAPI